MKVDGLILVSQDPRTVCDMQGSVKKGQWR
jgi:hypothetical protein